MRFASILIALICFLLSGCLDSSTDAPADGSITVANPDGPLQVVYTSITQGDVGEVARTRLHTTLGLTPGLDGNSGLIVEFNNSLDWATSENVFDYQINNVSLIGELNIGVFVGLTTPNSLFFWVSNIYSLIHQQSDLQNLIGATFSFVVNQNLKDIYGNTLAQPFQLSFVPEPYFRAYYFPVDFPNYSTEHDSLVVATNLFPRLEFSSAVDSVSLVANMVLRAQDGLFLEYVDKNRVEFEEIDGVNRYNYQYVITIQPDLVDIWGNKLIHGYEFRFTTRPEQ